MHAECVTPLNVKTRRSASGAQKPCKIQFFNCVTQSQYPEGSTDFIRFICNQLKDFGRGFRAPPIVVNAQRKKDLVMFFALVKKS